MNKCGNCQYWCKLSKHRGACILHSLWVTNTSTGEDLFRTIKIHSDEVCGDHKNLPDDKIDKNNKTKGRSIVIVERSAEEKI